VKLPVISKRTGMISRFGDIAENRGDHLAGHAVAGVDGNAQRALELEEPKDVLAILRPEIAGLVLAHHAGGADAQQWWRCA
jgi:hypothetical protein